MNQITVFDDFLSKEDCASLIDIFNSLKDNFRKVKDNRLLYINPKKENIISYVKKYVDKLNEKLQKQYYVREIMLSIYEPESYLDSHTDYDNPAYADNLGLLLYLNDDFEGGELRFSNKDLNFKPKQGSAVIFPCNNKEYIHEVTKITSGIRYTIPLEITLKKEQGLKSVYNI